MNIKSTLRTRTARLITIAAVTAGCAAGVSAYAATGPVTCNASQPVYSNNDYQRVGTYDVTLAPGQEVFLPDADVATCLKNGQLDIAQP